MILSGFAGGSPQGLFVSHDHGDTWAPVDGWNDHPMWSTWAEWPDVEGTPSGSLLHSVNVDPRDPDHLYLGLSGGGVFVHRLACEAPDLFAAIVSVSGATWKDPAKCAPSQGVALAEIHGDLHVHTKATDLLVFGPRGPIDNRLRYANEPARHKCLDIVGDLSLLEQDLVGHVVAYRSGHPLNIELARALNRQMTMGGCPNAVRIAA